MSSYLIPLQLRENAKSNHELQLLTFSRMQKSESYYLGELIDENIISEIQLKILGRLESALKFSTSLFIYIRRKQQ